MEGINNKDYPAKAMEWQDKKPHRRKIPRSLPDSYNKKLILARKRRLWTLEQAANMVGVSFQTYIRWEHGQQSPHASGLMLLCKVFEMTPEALGFGDLIGATGDDMPKYASCFFSYSSADRVFVERFYSDLRKEGVRCWCALMDLKIGESFQEAIDWAMRTHDKFLLVLSENSLKSSAVEMEAVAALRTEQISHGMILPVRLDDAIWQYHNREGWQKYIAQRHIGDFTSWQQPTLYRRSLDQLLHSLLLT
jgi:transcriptional regulator with XRE-family HTH domain